jgi:hypothetical protein
MGIGFVVILSGIAVFLRSTTVQRSSADLDRAIRTYSERLSNTAYDGTCPTDYTAVPVPSGFTSTLSISYWDGNASPAAFVATCPPSDRGVQRVAVTLTQASSGQRDQLLVVKRQP